MSGLFDKLASQLSERTASEDTASFYQRLSHELDSQPRGITTASLFSLPAAHRKLMLVLMRDSAAVIHSISVAELRQKYPDLGEDMQPILDDLVREGWLIVLGEAERTSYRVNLGRKPGSRLGFGIWSALSSRLQQGNP